MRLSHNELINLPVYTESEIFLGHIIGFEMDNEHHIIQTYLVGKHKLVDNLLTTILGENHLHVATSQVVSLDQEKMTVDDTVQPIGESVKRAAATPLA